MEFEKIYSGRQSYSCSVEAGKVVSLLKTDTSFTTVRCYDGSHIGVAGGIGRLDEQKLVALAESALERGIPYPCNLSDYRQTAENPLWPVEPALLTEKCGELTERLSDIMPGFTAGNKLGMESASVKHTNSKDGCLSYGGGNMITALSFKDRRPTGAADFSYVCVSGTFDPEAIAADCKALGDAFSREVRLPDRRLPVAMNGAQAARLLLGDFVAESYCSGAGRLAGRLKTKLFNDKLTVAIDRAAQRGVSECFFDAEGTPDSGFKLIDGGVFCGLISNKRSAAMFGLPLSASAGANPFDAVPSYSADGFTTLPTRKCVSDIARDYIYVAAASAEMAADGRARLNVQLAYLVEDGRPVGRLPRLMLTADIFDLLGPSYLGTAENSLYAGNRSLHDIFDVGVKAV